MLSSVAHFRRSPLLHAPLADDALFADCAGRAWIQSNARGIRRSGASDPRALDRYVFEYAPPTCWRIQVAQGWRYILKRNLNDAHIPLAMNHLLSKSQ